MRQTRLFRALSAPLSGLAMALMAAVSIPASVSGASGQANDFLPSDIRVLAAGTNSRLLRVRFERQGPAQMPAGQPCPATASYLIAGARGRLPQVRIRAAHYFQMFGGRVTDDAYDLAFTERDHGGEFALLRVLDVGQLRQYHAYKLALSWAVGRSGEPAGEMWLMDYLEAEIDLGPPEDTRNDGAQERREAWANARIGGPQLEGLGLLNPDIDPSYYIVANPQIYSQHTGWSGLINTDMRQGSVYRMSVYEPGAYMIPERLRTPGSLCRVYARGTQIPVFEDDTTSRPVCLFTVPPFDVAKEGPRVCWLSVTPVGTGTTSGSLTIPIANTDPLTTNVTVDPPSARFQSVAEVPADYHPRIRPDANVTRWYWKAVSDREIGAFYIDLPACYKPDPQSSRTLELTVYHATPHPVPQPPAVELIVNGAPDQLCTASASQGTIRYSCAPGRFKAGRNTIGLRVVYPSAAEGQQDILFQKIVAEWTQTLADAAETTGMFTPSDASARYLLLSHSKQDASPPVLVELGASPRATRPQMGLSAGSAGSFLLYRAQASGFRSPCMLVTPSLAPEPPIIECAAPLRLFDSTDGADYIAITTRALKPALMPLLQRRARQGWNVLLVDVQTLYDHFSYGEQHPEALRTFLAWALESWHGVKPQCVLLAGEAVDYQGNPALLSVPLAREIVPVFGNPRADGPRGDHPYAAVLGADSLCDLAVGRLPVATASELTSAVMKIEQYESASPGEWMSRALMVEDDNDEFPRAVADVLMHGSGPAVSIQRFLQSNYEYVPNVKVAGRKRPRAATRQLIEEFNNGQALVCFFGHGGPNLWTHERLLHLQDMPLLCNTPRLPLVVCASCDNAWLDYPIPPVQTSMGELLVKRQAGGAIGVFGPVSGASPFEHATLVGRLMEGITRANLRRLGDLVLYAKNQYLADSGSAIVPEQYVLVGDPAVELRIPSTVRRLDATPNVMHAGTRTPVTVAAAALPSSSGSDDPTATLRLQELSTGADVLSQTVAIMGGRVRTQVAVGALNPGNYALALHTVQAGQAFASAARLAIENPSLALDIARTRTASSQSLMARVINPCLGQVSDFKLRITDSHSADRVLLEDSFSMKPRTWREYPLDVFKGRAAEATISLSSDQGRMETSRTVQLAGEREGLTIAAPGLYPTAGSVSAVEPGVLTFAFRSPAQYVGSLQASLMENGTALCPPVTVEATTGSHTVNFHTQKPLAPGSQTLTVSITRTADANSTSAQPLLRHTQTIDVQSAPDLYFLPSSPRIRATGLHRAGTTIFIDAILVNSGAAPAHNPTVHLLIGDPLNGTPAASLNDLNYLPVPEVPGNSRMPITFRWENPSEGNHSLWLVVNRDKSVRESDYSNNTQALPPIVVVPMGDFRISSLSIDPMTVTVPSRLGYHVTCCQNGGTTCGPVLVEYGLKNPLTGVSESRTTSIRELGPDTSITLDLTTPAGPGFSVAYATINADRDQEEADPDNDTATVQILPVEQLDAPSVTAGGGQRLLLPLTDCWASGLEAIPGNGLRLMDSFTSSTGLIPISRDMVVGGAVADSSPSDDKWLVAPWLLEALGTENPGPVRLRIPVPDARHGVPHELRVELFANANYLGSPTGSFKVSINGEPARPIMYAPQTGPTGKRRVSLGLFIPHDNKVDITIEPQSGKTTALIAFEIVPSYGHAISSAFTLPPAWVGGRGQLEFSDTATSSGAVSYQVRTGRRSESGTIEWSAWTRLNGRTLALPAMPQTIQWQALVLQKEGDLRPVIESAAIQHD